MIYTFKEILEMHGSLIYELRRNLPTNEKERDAYVLGLLQSCMKCLRKTKQVRLLTL